MNATDWTDLAREGRTLEAIKAYRASAGIGLSEAKATVERWVDVNLPPSVGYQRARTIAGRVADQLAGSTTQTGRPLGWMIRALATSPADHAGYPSILFAECLADRNDHDLCVEVALPGVSGSLRRETARELLSTGVRMVWFLDPELRTVMVYKGSMRGTELDESETLDGGDVLPGFSCKVSDLFA